MKGALAVGTVFQPPAQFITLVKYAFSDTRKGARMCIAPLTLADGVQTACHECWQCRERRVNDWVGRCIAESKTSKGANVVTLTYGRSRLGDVDHERATILTYSDVQKYLKLLRRHGFPVRYLVAGEFGSLKGRAHWHAVLYWQDRIPPHELLCNFMEDHWPHGWSFWDRASAQSVRYICKYILKDMGDDARQGHLAMSKKPPLGAVYFAQMAERYVQSQLAPQDLFYTFPEVRRGKPGAQEVVEFMLNDRSAELFLEHYVRTWRAVHGKRPWPVSELVEAYDENRSIRGFVEAAKRALPRWEAAATRKPRVWRDDIDVEINMEKEHGKGQEEVGYHVERDDIGRLEFVRRGGGEAARLDRLRRGWGRQERDDEARHAIVGEPLGDGDGLDDDADG